MKVKDMNVEMPVVHVLRPNFTRVHVGALVLWFSYQTLVAFRYGGGRLTVRRNDWGPTTGKHLNAIDTEDERSRRVDGNTFAGLYADMMKENGIRI